MKKRERSHLLTGALRVWILVTGLSGVGCAHVKGAHSKAVEYARDLGVINPYAQCAPDLDLDGTTTCAVMGIKDAVTVGPIELSCTTVRCLPIGLE